MISEDSKPNRHNPGETSVPVTEGRVKWTLTRQALDKLLDRFSPDREEAIKQFEVMKGRLDRYFEWRSSPAPDRDVDETIDRVARKLDEGENIINLNGYFLSVARLVLLESLREQERTPLRLDDISETESNVTPIDEVKEARLSCLDKCLSEMPIDTRTLLLRYYQEQGHAKIEVHERQAEVLGITLNALRIRVCRIRRELEKRVKEALEHLA